MDIIVYNPAASEGGALTILKSYYEKAKFDKDNNWKFIVSTTELENSDNIQVYSFPWTKKSWFHRIYFENFIWPKLYAKLKGDRIISLQNILAPHVKQMQDLYFHQALVFSDYKFSFFENKLFWVYQNIISKIIFKSLKKAKTITVQANWIKDEVVNKLNIEENKVIVEYPKVMIKESKFQRMENSNKRFFYPAGAYPYKNHKVIIEASNLLLNNGIKDFEIYFTLEGNENEYSKKILNSSNDNIKFIGKLDQNQVEEYYMKSTLVFSSYIETNGLPLTEARNLKSQIIACDEKFSREVLKNYEKCKFFDTFSANDLAEKMKEEITKK